MLVYACNLKLITKINHTSRTSELLVSYDTYEASAEGSESILNFSVVFQIPLLQLPCLYSDFQITNIKLKNGGLSHIRVYIYK